MLIRRLVKYSSPSAPTASLALSALGLFLTSACTPVLMGKLITQITLPSSNVFQIVAYPASPNNLSSAPLIKGITPASTSTVQIYSDSSCSVLLNQGTKANFESTGISVSLAANQSSDLYVQSLDASGLKSNCSDGHYVYVNDTGLPIAVTAVTHAARFSFLNQSPLISWTGGGTDALSGFDHYEYSLGTSAGDTSIKPWSSTGTQAFVTTTGLSLSNGVRYYANVRAVDKAGNHSLITSSTGWIAGGATKLVFTQQPSSSAVAGVNLTQAPQVSLQDSGSATVTAQTDLVTLAPYTDAACTVPLTSGSFSSSTNPVSAVAGVASFTSVSETLASVIYLKATSGSLISACSQGVTVVPGPATQVQFMGPSIATAASCTRGFLLKTTDNFGNLSAVSSDQNFAISSSGSGAFYADSACSFTTSNFTILAGNSTGASPVYFKDSAVELTSLTASLTGFTNAAFVVSTRSPQATAVFGQPDFLTNQNYNRSFYGPETVFSVGTKLFIGADHRVIAYNTLPTVNFTSFDFALGVPNPNYAYSDFYSPNLKGISGMTSDGTKLLISNHDQNRVVIWNTLPSSNALIPDVVIGQASLYDSTGRTGANGLSGPSALALAGSKLILADSGNHRVLIWNSIPTSNQQAADVVIGQADFTANQSNEGGSPTKWSLSSPTGVALSGTKLLIADTQNNRVLVFDSIPTLNHTAADHVIGQTSFTSSAAGTSATQFHSPSHLFADSRIYLSDSENNRILIYNSLPTSDGVAADLVLGQGDFIYNGYGSGASSLNYPRGITKDNAGHLVVADFNNARVLTWTNPIASNGQGADLVQGQPNLSENFVTNPGPLSSTNLSLDQNAGVCTDGTRLFVADTHRGRILVWNALPSSTQQAPDFVLGQDDFVTRAPYSVSAQTLNNPTSVDCDASHLAVTDTQSNRVLIWNGAITANHQAANLVIGQTDFISSSGGSSRLSLNNPKGVSIRNGKLIVADSANHRVLLWNSVPTISGALPDAVLGQPNFTSNNANQAGYLDLHSLAEPLGIFYDGSHVFVADHRNQRLLIWNSFPSTNQAAADVSNDQCGALSVFSNGTSLYASAHYYNGSQNLLKLCVWNQIPTLTNQSVDRVIGQARNSSDNYHLGADGVSGSVSMSGSGSHFFLLDQQFQRLLIYDHEP